MQDEELWRVANDTPEELIGRFLSDIESFVAKHPSMAANKIRSLAERCQNLEYAIQSEAWQRYHREYAEWMKTYNAAITGLYAGNPKVSIGDGKSPWRRLHEHAEAAAIEMHGPKPEKPVFKTEGA